MPSIVPGFEYDIFISYRHNDNRSGWVTDFVSALQEELAATIKEPLSIYFDKNPHDGLLETHNVDKSLEGKLKCLIFIPIISQTYCDTKSFAWQHEFCGFNKLSTEDQFGRDVKLGNGNVASRILPVKIHDLDNNDKATIENEIGGALRAIEFIFKSPGVNRPLRANEDHPMGNQNKSIYRDQINKLANSIKDLITAIQNPNVPDKSEAKGHVVLTRKSRKSVASIAIAIILILGVAGYLIYPKIFPPGELPEIIDKSIAVLPFVNISSDPSQEYFGDGIADEIINVLAQRKELRVIARTSSFSFKGKKEDLKSIGEKLGVAFIIEGSVRREGDTVRILAQLIRVSDNSHIWSETYNRPLTRVLKVQNEIAEAIDKKLEVSLPLESEWQSNAVNKEAYLLTMHGNYLMSLFNVEAYRKALISFEEAARIDPLYAPAFAGLALAYLELGGWHVSSGLEYINEAIKHANHAIELDDQLADSYIVLGRIYFYQFDWNKAESNLSTGIRLKPNATAYRILYANFLTAMGRFQESIRFGLQTTELDPLSGNAFAECGWVYFLARQDKMAVAFYEKGLELESNYPIGLLGMGWLMAELDRKQEALAYVDRAYQIISGEPTLSILAAHTYALAGRKDKAVQIHDRLLNENKLQEVSHFSLALLWLVLDDKPRAIDELERAYQQRDLLLVWLKTFRTFDSIRTDARFIELYNKMHFPD